MPKPCPRPLPLALLLVLSCLFLSCRGTRGEGPTREAPTGRERWSGLLELELDREEGRAFWVLPQGAAPTEPLARLLLVEGLATGLGSNPVGLDRGRAGPARVVALRRVGSRVVVEAENHRFRASGADGPEERVARESFATSVLWAGPIVRRADGRLECEITSFVVRDAHGVARELAQAGQGDFRLDPERSALDPGGVLVFPDNVELQALLTFESAAPGPEVRATAPMAGALSVVQHISLVRLPDDDFEPRAHDPRSGAIALRFQDHAAPPERGVERAWAIRHRLHKRDPGAALSEPARKIVFHVDPGIPEPVRTAVLEGARWWESAFREAGFLAAFEVQLLPEGVHPLDARYHVIQGVHRATRGWSYGNSIVDPRTGEIVKAHVRLGSQRVRHDVMLFEALAGVERTGSGDPDDPLVLALDRIRQLSAHEVGHTLGLAHNFAASTHDGRASVMDYPAPWVRVGLDGRLDFSRTYARGLGDWDKVAIRYLYEQPPPSVDLRARLERILSDAEAAGQRFLSDADARPADAAHPFANLWDNGANAVTELQQVLEVRRIALERFGAARLHAGQSRSRLQEVFVPLYLYHRYQLEAAGRLIGGVLYDHAVEGGFHSGQAVMVHGNLQRQALLALLAALEPEVLDVPDAILSRLLPPAPGTPPTAETLAGRTGPVFDLFAAAESAADLVLGSLLEPARCARLVEQHVRVPRHQLALEEYFELVLDGVFRDAPSDSPRVAELRRSVQALALARFFALADDPAASSHVRWRAEGALAALAAKLRANRPADRVQTYFHGRLVADIERFLARPFPERPAAIPASPAPPGPPIGAGLDPGCHGQP